MSGHKMKMFRFMLRCFGVFFLCCLTFGVGFLWGVPWIVTATAKFYDDINIEKHTSINLTKAE